MLVFRKSRYLASKNIVYTQADWVDICDSCEVVYEDGFYRVYPYKSNNTSFNVELQWCEDVKPQKEEPGFKVLECYYPSDVEEETVKYLKKGYQIINCGYRFDKDKGQMVWWVIMSKEGEK